MLQRTYNFLRSTADVSRPLAILARVSNAQYIGDRFLDLVVADNEPVNLMRLEFLEILADSRIVCQPRRNRNELFDRPRCGPRVRGSKKLVEPIHVAALSAQAIPKSLCV
jgi:hypothetical protein